MVEEDHSSEREGGIAEASRKGEARLTAAEAEARGLFSLDLAERRLSLLRGIVPEAFGEGGVDWELLRRLVEGSAVKGREGGEEEEEGEEVVFQPFGLQWAGMLDAEREVVRRTTKCLRPQREESVDWKGTGNVFVEGENLEVLKLLRAAYWGSVKMIYIDPPYNTGKDFIYSDKFAQTAEAYGRESGQTDEEGQAYSTNKESDGRFHSKWLSMMYPRLAVARDLLSEDGVIFISIDDNEVHHLRMLCNKIFGDENFVAQFAWRKTDNQANIGNVARVKEYIICYSKNSEFCEIKKMKLTERAEKEYRYYDTKGQFRRRILLDKTRGRHNYNVKTPSGKILSGPWMKKEEVFKKMQEDDAIYWTSGGQEQPYGKIYRYEIEGQITNDFLDIEYGTNQQGSLEVEHLFHARYFDFPKPYSLIKHFVTIGTNSNDTILDFFAGSCTTAHAVMQLNTEDGGQRRFVMVQLDEKTPENSRARHAGYKTIAAIGRERIRRAALKIKEDFATKDLMKDDRALDFGFKSFVLDSSNFKIWEHDIAKIPDLQKAIEEHVDRRKQGRSQEDVLYEIMLKYGYPLTSTITEKSVAQHRCHFVDLSGEKGKLFFCLQDKIGQELLDTLLDMEAIPRHIVMFDHAFAGNTSLRVDFHHAMKTKAQDTQQDITVTTL